MRVVAIDGPVGSGKSTVAKAVAVRLGLPYLESGAMYRVVALAAVRRGIDPEAADASEALTALAAEIPMEIGEQVLLEGVDVTADLRSKEVGRVVSAVAAEAGVRTELVRRQREWVEEHGGAVVEGRDIGSVVFPDAALKVYLTASPEVRAARRAQEVSDLDYGAVSADLARRDAMDASRQHDPLRQADDALIFDTSGLGVDEVVDALVARLRGTTTGG